MRKTHFSIAAAAIVASLTLVGCGGGSSSSSTSTGSLQLNPYLSNIDYACGTNSGTTGANGQYSFDEGDTCTFTIGGLDLTASPESNLTVDEILENALNSGVSKDAIWGYMSAATGLSQAEMSAAETITVSDNFKNATADIRKENFISFDKFETALLADADFNAMTDLKAKFEKNKAKLPSVKTDKRVELSFEEITTPVTEERRNTQQASATAYVNGASQSIGYTQIMKTGYEDNDEILGLSKDYQDKPIKFTDGSAYICNGTNGGAGSGMDFTSFLNVNDKLYVVSQFECGPGSMYMAELEQDITTGKLSAKEGTLQFISQKDEFGGWVHCAGKKTPWESHLGSEEYEADGSNYESNGYFKEFGKFWGKNDYSPYYYGWTPEVKIVDGEADYAKHYAMGRFSHEISYVMPDNKTVYLSDDGTNVGLFMYVADTPKDLSAGTLYAAKWNQTSEDGVGLGEANITWISLGHATNSEIREYLDADNDITTNDALTFTDIFDAVEGTDGTCAEGYTSINTTAGHECLSLKKGMEKAASRLETRRYAAYLGATTEFRKEEGITFDKNTGTLYVAMSQVAKGMEDDSSNDLGGNNDIRVEKNSCGAVYAMDVATSAVTDTKEAAISSEYVVNNMYGVIGGSSSSYSKDSVYAGNSCDVNAIANPDNITFLDNSDILMIGEDAGYSTHNNNVVWSYNVKTKELVRAFTTPVGAETTSPFWYSDLANGFGYLSVVTQHPGMDTTDAGESSIGYVGPFSNLTDLNSVETISSITKLATLDTKIEGGSEIVAFDKSSSKMFSTNGANNTLDITTMNSDGTLGTTTSIDLSTYGAGVQSVATSNGNVAVAIGSANKVTTRGKVVVFDTAGTLVSQTTVGYLPDMVTFSEDGKKVIVANEGEPSAEPEGYTVVNEETSTNVSGLGDYVDVPGSVGIVTLENADAEDNANGYAEVGFTADDLSDAADGTAVRLGGTPSNDVALDMEPEYIAVSGNYAYVTLQENNALAKIDISSATPTVMGVQSLGAKDYETENTIDILRDDQAYMTNYTALKGLYMPDSVASYVAADNKTYIVTANEGDGREYCLDTDPDCDDPVYADEKRISSGTLQKALISSLETYYKDLEDEVGDIDMVKSLLDMTDVDNESVYIMGGRSFSIWDENGSLVFDSGSQLSNLTAKFMPTLFNQDEGKMDKRSDDKGVEPEALTVGTIGTKTYAFIGLERQNAIVIYDITTPTKSKFVKYIPTEEDGDISPEGMKFIAASDSPTGNALLLVAFEVSGTTAVYEIK